MDKTELNHIVEAWVAGASAKHGSQVYERNWWAISRVSDWALEGNGDLLWQFVLATYTCDLPNNVIAVLAAGPLEDLLAKHGTEFIDRVEELARKDPRFNYLLGGVWRNSMSEEVWQRVQAIRNHVW